MEKKENANEEYVLVFPVRILENLKKFQGFNPDVKNYLKLILKEENTLFIKRKYAENNPIYKQIIPYVILKYGDTYFTYQRSKIIFEKRLSENFSLGIGGHISISDRNLFNTTYEEGLNREVNEEVQINSKYSNNLIGIINDDTNKVGRVHFGIVHLFELESDNIKTKEKIISNPSFITKKELIRKINTFENWSQLFIKYMMNKS